MIRVLIVDDQENVRRGLRMRLALEPDLTVVGEAADGEAAVGLAGTLQPQVVVMDIEMPRMDGIAATAALAREQPACRVVILSMHDDPATRARAGQAGACAFVCKGRMDEALIEAIRDAASTETPPVG